MTVSSEILQSDELDLDVLRAALGEATVGSDMSDGDGTFVRLRNLEGRRFRSPLGIITPNPNQPRKLFRDEDIQALAESIRSMGQKVPIKVVPFVDGDGVRLYIVDGECRWRALQLLGETHAWVEIDWEESEHALLETSFLLNIRRAGHTPIEIAQVLKRMVDHLALSNGGEAPAQDEVARRTGYTRAQVRSYLEFLTYPSEIQQMLHLGTLSEANVLQLRRAKARGRASTPDLRRTRMELAARALLEVAEGRKQEVDSRRVTDGPLVLRHKDIERLQAAADAGEVGHERARELAVAKSLLAARRAATIITNKIRGLVDGATREEVNTALRNLPDGRPPEALRDILEAASMAVSQLLEVVDEYLKPPPLEEPPGRPPLHSFIIGHASAFAHDTRYRIALLLAACSHSGEVRTMAEIAAELGIETTEVAGHFSILRKELAALDLTISNHPGRQKDARGKYEFVSRYRFEWIISTIKDES